MNILLLSAGGGGGNILRSLKASFRRDLTITQQADARYAERLRRAVTTRFLDTNEFALSDLPKEERVVIGAQTTGRIGARHNPDVAREALIESRDEVEALVSRYSIIVLIGTGGKGTGAGTMFPLAQIAREQKKLVIPIFVRPSFERHEVDKRRYDHAVRVIEHFDAARIRLIEILNDRGYTEDDPQSQAVVWERMNRPIARGLRGLIYVLWDLGQVDPSDLSTLFAGDGRLRIGFAEIDPPARQEPSDELVEHAARTCWENPYYAFHRPVGTALICIQGDWSNLVDAKIKGRLATAAMGLDSKSPYSPLYARAVNTPKPWGVTALFSEYTGTHRPLEVDWGLERGIRASAVQRSLIEPAAVVDFPRVAARSNGSGEAPIDSPIVAPSREVEPLPSFSSFWDFAVAINRADPVALALATNGADSGIPIEGAELKKLLGTMWFRAVVPRLSEAWRDRILDVLIETVPMPNHVVRLGRHTAHLSELSYAQLQEVITKTFVPDAVRPDLDLLMTVGRFWGAEAVGRFRFVETTEPHQSSKLASLLQGFRG